MSPEIELSDKQFLELQSFWLPLKRDCQFLKNCFIDLKNLDLFLDQVVGGKIPVDGKNIDDVNFRLRTLYVLADFLPIVFGRIFDPRSDTFSLDSLQGRIGIIFKANHVISDKIKIIKAKYRVSIDAINNIRDKSKAHNANPFRLNGKNISVDLKNINEARNTTSSFLLLCPIPEICIDLEDLITDIEAIRVNPPSTTIVS